MKEKVYSSDGETFNDDCACYDNGDTYWSGDKREIRPSELVNSSHVDSLFESMLEGLYEDVGEVAESGFDMDSKAEHGLLDVIKDAVDMYLSVKCYGVDNIKEHVMSDEDIE